MGEPVRVTAWMAGPLLGDAPHLDALLEWVMAPHVRSIAAHDRTGRHRGCDEDEPRREATAPRPGLIPIPIDRREVAGWPVALCSSPILVGVREDGVQRLASRLSTGEWGDAVVEGAHRTIHHGSGSTRAQYRPIRQRLVERVIWFAVAHRDSRARREGRTSDGSPLRALRKLLRRVEGVGKFVGHGGGAVARWEVERVDRDVSWYAESAEGPVLMRPLPAGRHLPAGLRGARPDVAAVCAPYWHPERLCEAVTPC